MGNVDGNAASRAKLGGDTEFLDSQGAGIGIPVGTPPSEDFVRFTRDVHRIVRDLITPSQRIFFIDFLATTGVAYVATAVYMIANPWGLMQFAAWFISAAALYRASVFIHELEHCSVGSFRTFKYIWNVFFGIPCCMPSFLYDNHVAHHSRNTYGTNGDSEYLSLAHQPRALRALFFASIGLVNPILGPLRFLLATPLALLSSRLNRRVWVRRSSLYMLNPQYRRTFDASAQSITRWTSEIACSVWAWMWVVLIWNEAVPLAVVGKYYFLFASWMVVNQLRTLTAHRYERRGDPSTYGEQFLDSNTFHRGYWAELWAPMSLRYHALHHLIPNLPYHAMGTAHRRLLQCLPADSLYHRTLRPGFLAALRDAFFGAGIPDGKLDSRRSS